jgi:hypothetical protein
VKVFISWSSEQSKHIALALRDWLPLIIQVAKNPYMSKKDNEAGTLWDHVLSAELETTNFGIVCLTPSNLEARWINFEAGALSKAVGKARVVPLLYDLEEDDVGPPLSRFQMKLLTEEGIYDLLTSMNSWMEEQDRLDATNLERLFKSLWPDLKAQLDKVPTGPESPGRNDRELLTEILGLVRGLTWKDSSSFNYATAGAWSLSGSRAKSDYLTMDEENEPPSALVMNRLVKIAGSEGAVTVSGKVPHNVVVVRSSRFRPGGNISLEEMHFLENTRDFLAPYGVMLLAHSPEEGGEAAG